MGNKELQELKVNNKIELRLKFVKNIDDEFHQDIKLMEDITLKKLFAMKSNYFSSNEDYLFGLSFLKKRFNIKHNNVVDLIKYKVVENQDHCLKFKKIYTIYEYFDNTLLNLMQKKSIENNDYFTEDELLDLVDSILSALIFFEKNKIYHGDIRPNNIFFSKNEEKVYKISDINFLDNLNGYQRMILGTENISYLNNDLLLCLMNRELEPFFNKQKSEIFSFGLTLLQVSLLIEDIEDLYDFHEFNLKKDKISIYLENLKIKYSQEFHDLVCLMLNFEDKEISYKDILKNLKKINHVFCNLNIEGGIMEDEESFESKDNYNRKEKIKLKALKKNKQKNEILLNNEKFFQSYFANYQSTNYTERIKEISKIREVYSKRKINKNINEYEENDSFELFDFYLSEYHTLSKLNDEI